ncbi:MAG: CAF17-like 4Fe-4S cluster assembly/insertion protein YgfZ [Acidimicrobiales bacterium]
MSKPDNASQYEALRHGAGARLTARDVVTMTGPDAPSFLQGQCSQDVVPLHPGSSADALVLSPQGKIDALVRVVRVAEDAFALDLDPGFGTELLARLVRFKLRVKVELELFHRTCLSVRGPHARDVVHGNPIGTGDVAISYSWGSIEGVDVLCSQGAPAIPSGAVECHDDAWEALRVEAGIPSMGAEIDERTIAAEVDGLLDRAVSFTKGCYTGQELVARLDARGNKVVRHLRGLVCAGSVRPGDVIRTDGRDVGTVTSSALSPVLGAVALGFVHRQVEVGAAVRIGEHQQAVVAEVRQLPLL